MLKKYYIILNSVETDKGDRAAQKLKSPLLIKYTKNFLIPWGEK